MWLRNDTDKISIRQKVNALKLKESNWVLYIINNSNNLEAYSASEHWSLTLVTLVTFVYTLP